jgi:CBS domain-containing protein
MFQRRIGSLPVVDGDRLVGMLTDRDIVRAFRKAQGLEDLADRLLW